MGFLRYLGLLLLGCGQNPLEGISIGGCRWQEGATVAAPLDSCALVCTEPNSGYATHSQTMEGCEAWTCRALQPGEEVQIVYDVARHDGAGPGDHTIEQMSCEELAAIVQESEQHDDRP